MIKLDSTIDLTGYALILPSVAVGNVGQLAIDLLVCTLNLKKIGRFFNSDFIPIVGVNPYMENNQDICTTLDLYTSKDKKLVVLQIRSPLANKPTNFIQQIHSFISDSGISKVYKLHFP